MLKMDYSGSPNYIQNTFKADENNPGHDFEWWKLNT